MVLTFSSVILNFKSFVISKWNNWFIQIDKGVVGQIDLGFGLDLGFKTNTKPEEDDKPDKMQELVDKLKSN